MNEFSMVANVTSTYMIYQSLIWSDFLTGYIFNTLLLINIIFGTPANFIILSSILLTKNLRVQKFYGIISLSSVDLLVCSVSSPLQIIREVFSLHESKSLRSSICTFITVLSTWTSLASILSLFIISLERYLLFRNKKSVGKIKFILVCLFLHLISLLFGLLNGLLNWKYKSYLHTRCSSTEITSHNEDSIYF